MGIKLWVDDIRNPVWFVGDGWHWVKTVTEAICIIDEQDIEAISLDHDISMKVSVGYGDARPFCSPETFEPVARFIAAKYLHEIHGGRTEFPPITLHTASSVGAEKMKRILNDAGLDCAVSLSKPCNRFEDGE